MRVDRYSRRQSTENFAVWAILVTVMVVLSISLASCGGVAGTTSSTPTTPTPAPTPTPTPTPPPPPPVAQLTPKVMVVVEENKIYTDVIGSSSMPFLNSLATQYGLATNYFAVDQPSLPNYLMLTTGQTIVTHTDTYSGPPIDVDNVVRELKALGKTWKSYAESLPSPGYLGGDQPPYVQHHNPFVLFSDVVNDPVQQQNIVPVTQLATDLAAGNLPDFSFVVPNNQNNSHDCPPGMAKCALADTLANSDTWLKNTLGPVLNDPTFQKSGLLFIVYDESSPNDTAHGGGHVACVLAGGLVKPAFQSAVFYQHQSVLRTALKVLGGTTFPGEAANAPDMSEFLNIQ